MKAGPGRPRGVVNKVTASVKECITKAFDDLGGVDGLVEWAQSSDKNRAAFYQTWGRLAPREVIADMKGNLTVIIRNEAAKD